MIKKISFLKIFFYNFETVNIERILKKRGLFLFPSGPGLADLKKNPKYHEALINADLVFFDSGYFVLLLNILKNIKVKKFSGYKFIKILFDYFKKRNTKNIFFIDPSKTLSTSYKKYAKNHLNIKSNHYIAPKYNQKKIVDKILLKKISTLKPKYIIINLGGGVQELLGFHLKKNLKYKPTIICTGAAIAYLTGDQASIGDFYDKIYVGWLIRILFKPNIFFYRYLNSFGLLFSVLGNKVKEYN